MNIEKVVMNLLFKNNSKGLNNKVINYYLVGTKSMDLK